MGFSKDVAVIGGCGHVGLPLALMFADDGLRTVIYDISRPAVEVFKVGWYRSGSAARNRF